jgi:hypothetical protein
MLNLSYAPISIRVHVLDDPPGWARAALGQHGAPHPGHGTDGRRHQPGQEQMGSARHVIGCRSTQETRLQKAFDEVAGIVHRPLNPGNSGGPLLDSGGRLVAGLLLVHFLARLDPFLFL